MPTLAAPDRICWTLRMTTDMAERLREVAHPNERGLAAECRHALRRWLDAGAPLVDHPDATGSTRTLRLSSDLYNALSAAGDETGLSKSAVMRMAIAWHLTAAR